MRTLWLSFLIAFPLASTVAAIEVPVTVTEPAGVARTNEVASGGIPLPEGKYKDPAAFSLYDGTTEVPLQVDPIVKYPDGSLHWVLLSFPVTLPPGGRKTYVLKATPGKAAPAHAVTVKETNGRVIVSNGLVRLALRRDRFNGIESLSVAGKEVFRAAKAGLTANGAGGPAKPTHFEFRYRGPVRTTLYVKGTYGDLKTPTWAMTITLCAGEPRIHIEHHIRNGGIGVRTINVDSAKMHFGLAGKWTADKSGRKLPAFAWQRFAGPGDPLVFVRHGGGGVRAREIRYRIEADGAELVIDQTLTGGKFKLSEGTHKITEVDLAFGGGLAPAALAAPLHALAAPGWYARHDSMGVGLGFGSIEDETAAYKAMGWKGAGDPRRLPREKPHPDLYKNWMNVHGTTEADQLRGLTVQYVRTGQRGFLDRATAWSRLHRTRYLWRTDDFTFGVEGRRRVHKWGGDRWCNCHAYGAGLFNYALLTGNPDALEAAFDAAEHANAVYGTRSRTKPGANFSWWGSRPFARLYEIVARAYEVARTPEWRKALVHFVQVATKTPQRDPRGFTNHGVISTWTSRKLRELKHPRRGSPAAVALFEKEGTKILARGLCEHPKYGRWHPRCVGTWPEAMEAMANFQAAQLLARSKDPAARLAAEDAMDYAIAEAYFGARYAFDPVQKCVYYYFYVDFPIPDYVPLWKGGKWDTYQPRGTDSWYTKWWPNPLAAGYVLTGDRALRDKSMEVLWWGLSRVYVHPPRVPKGHAPPYAWISRNTKGDFVSTTALAFGVVAHPRKDTTPPAAITDLAARALGGGKVELTWTEPADADGKVARFQVKHAAKPIKDYLDVRYRDERLTVTYWNMAANVLGEPAPAGAGTRHRMTLAVPPGQRHFAVRSFDAAHNRSRISNVVGVEVK